MRNAAATFDDDYDYDAPVRRTAPRKPRAPSTGSGKSKSRKKKGRRFAIDMHKVARVAAIGMSATLAIGIMVNALMMQKGHHPAPLFGKSTLAVIAPVVAPMPAKVARVSIPDPTPVAEDAPPVAAPAPLPVLKPRHVADRAATKAPGGDQIAKLLETGVAPAASTDKSDGKVVLGAQKALAKLGFVLKPSGTMGPATKKAIEAFEKERNMPVDGELSHRVVKILSAESGVKID